MPFRQQRDYWRGPDGSKVERMPSLSRGKTTRLAA
jgi:hypothetical protein